MNQTEICNTLVTQVPAEIMHKEGIQRSWYLCIYAYLSLVSLLRELFKASIAMYEAFFHLRLNISDRISISKYHFIPVCVRAFAGVDL